jgi:RNA polymerase sigma factor (sigma-70 family)
MKTGARMFGIVTRRARAPAAAEAARPSTPARPTTDAQDVLLIGRIAAGRDMRALETLYRAYHARVSRFVGLFAAQPAIVEETLNDTMLVVWNRADTFNHQSKVSTWIFAIAYRTACKALRRQEEPPPDADPDELPCAGAGPERQLSDGQTRDALARALDGLSGEQRSALVLTYFHDLPYAEIAQIMGCPVDTVKTRVFHGRRRLRALLSGELRDWL